MVKNVFIFLLACQLFVPQREILAQDGEHYLEQKKLTLEEIHGALFDLYFPDDAQLSTNERKKRNEWRDELFLYIKNKPEIVQLLSLLQPDSPVLPQDVKEDFSELFTQGVAHVSEQKIRELQYRLRRHPDNNVRKFAFTLRKLYSYLVYAGPVTAKIAGYSTNNVPVKCDETVSFTFPQSELQLIDNSIIHQEGPIDYLIIGSGPAGSVIAHELTQHLKCRVVLIDTGSFIKPSSIVTESLSDLMEANNMRTTVSGGIAIRNGQAIGGGTTVNLDLAFSPLLPQIQRHVQGWINEGYIDREFIHEDENDWKKVEHAYKWVTDKIGTRVVSIEEVNDNNELLLKASPTARTYCLNARPLRDDGDKRLKISAVDAFIMPALCGGSDYKGSFHIIPDAKVQRLVFETTESGKKVTEVVVQFQSPFDAPYCIKDPNNLGVDVGNVASIKAKNIIVCAGALGSAEILLRSKVNNDAIGKGIVLHPSMGMYGRFDKEIDVLKGISASVYAPSVDPDDDYFFESMSAEPAFIALINPGNGRQILDIIRDVKYLGGFGAMLIDTVNAENRVFIDPVTQRVEVDYHLCESDKDRLRKAMMTGVEMLLNQGASEVYIPTTEPLLSEDDDYRPFTSQLKINHALNKLQFIENQNFISSAHMQGSCKIGNDPHICVVSRNFKVWDNAKEIDNLFVCDSSIFPTSVGANPMQSIYTFSKLFVDRHIKEKISETEKDV